MSSFLRHPRVRAWTTPNNNNDNDNNNSDENDSTEGRSPSPSSVVAVVAPSSSTSSYDPPSSSSSSSSSAASTSASTEDTAAEEGTTTTVATTPPPPAPPAASSSTTTGGRLEKEGGVSVSSCASSSSSETSESLTATATTAAVVQLQSTRDVLDKPLVQQKDSNKNCLSALDSFTLLDATSILAPAQPQPATAAVRTPKSASKTTMATLATMTLTPPPPNVSSAPHDQDTAVTEDAVVVGLPSSSLHSHLHLSRSIGSSSSGQLRQRRGRNRSSRRHHPHSNQAGGSAGGGSSGGRTSLSQSLNRHKNNHDHHHDDEDHEHPHGRHLEQHPHEQDSRETASPPTGGGRRAMSGSSVAKDEHRLRKVLVRIWFGLIMLMFFALLLYSGHVYICLIVALCQIILFRELVKVRYNTYFHLIEQNIPLFRTTQWMWFCVAVFYTYSDFAVELIQNNTSWHHLLAYAYWQGLGSFVLYSGTFVLTIATMQIGFIRFQLNQLCWTIVVLCLTVGQMKYIMHNVYNGLFWFALPVALVATNDIFAYFSGMACGRKFIRRPFISLSPNKTWEGFIGGWFFTMIAGWYLSRIMARYAWMVCPTNVVSFWPKELECDLDPIFHEAESIFPTQIFELFPLFLVKMVPGVVEICSVQPPPTPAVMPVDVGSTSKSKIPASLLHDDGEGDTNNDGTVLLPSPASLTTDHHHHHPSHPHPHSQNHQTHHHHHPSMVLKHTTHQQPLKLTNCISGDPTHAHHHFELTLQSVLPVQIHALALSLFASLVAPFGGFLASGMKRAYGIKDFDSIIPGHGGMMDRLDCQFLMALYTWVHYNAFVKLTTVSVPKMLYMYNLMKEREQAEFLERVVRLVQEEGREGKF